MAQSSHQGFIARQRSSACLWTWQAPAGEGALAVLDSGVYESLFQTNRFAGETGLTPAVPPRPHSLVTLLRCSEITSTGPSSQPSRRCLQSSADRSQPCAPGKSWGPRNLHIPRPPAPSSGGRRCRRAAASDSNHQRWQHSPLQPVRWKLVAVSVGWGGCGQNSKPGGCQSECLRTAQLNLRSPVA